MIRRLSNAERERGEDAGDPDFADALDRLNPSAAGMVPPLLAAAERAGVPLAKMAEGFYRAGKITGPLVTISVRSEGYTARLRYGRRWRMLCKDAKRPATAMAHIKSWCA